MEWIKYICYLVLIYPPVTLFRCLKKSILDMASTCYEDQDFKVMSLPRLAFFISIWLIVFSTIAEQIFKYPFSHYTELLGFLGASATSYVSKKYIDKDK
jgi:hypothetical protein